MLYFFVKQNFDLPYGGTSGYILNVMMSALYIILLALAERSPQLLVPGGLEQDAGDRQS